MIHRIVGEVFEYNGVTLQVKRPTGENLCDGCFFAGKDGRGCSSDKAKSGSCCSKHRPDGDVIFVEVKESGFSSMIGDIVTAEPMFSKRETLVLEFAKAIILSPGRIFGSQSAENYINTAVAFADQFLSQMEQQK